MRVGIRKVGSLLRRSFAVATIAVVLPTIAAAAESAPIGVRAARAAPKEPAAAHCVGDPNPDSPTKVGPSIWDDETLSGGRYNDQIVSTHANPICAYQGNDLIRAWQPGAGIPNEISGGPHKDKAIVDQKDLANITNVELCKLSPGAPRWRSCSAYVSKARK